MDEQGIRAAFESIYGSNLLNDMKTMLQKLPTDPEFASAWGSVQSLYNSLFVPFAWCIMLIFFMVHVIDEFSYRELTPEKLFKSFAKLVLAAAIIANGFTLLGYFLKLGGSLIDSFSFTASTDSSVIDSLMAWARTETDGFKMFKCIWFSIKLFIPQLISWLMNIVVTVVCYGRFLELMLKTLFAPVALCDVFGESYGHSSSIRYFRGYAATCLQGVVIFAIGWLYSQVSAALMTTGTFSFESVLGFLAVNLAAIMLIVKSSSFAKELCGTN